MITLPNGHQFIFCCAAGALGFDGRGYWWERPLHWLGMLRHPTMTVITKTLTLEPRQGNLNMWCPWRSVRLIKGGAVNAIGLTNPGLDWWMFYHFQFTPAETIVSIAPSSPMEGEIMAGRLNRMPIKGIEVNLSCPNSDGPVSKAAILEAVRTTTRHPVIAKLGTIDIAAIKDFEPHVDAFDLINSEPWPNIFPDRESPLARYDLSGGVSGLPIRDLAREALKFARSQTSKPIISGGAITDCDEVFLRESLGAEAFSLGIIYLRKPWKPCQIIDEYDRRKDHRPTPYFGNLEK